MANIDWVMAGAVVITGLVVVFAALVLLWWVMALMGKVLGTRSSGGQDKGKKALEPAAKNTPVTNQPALATQNQEVSDEVVAVITAAISAMTGSNNFVVKSIRRSGQFRSPWAMAGLHQNIQAF